MSSSTALSTPTKPLDLLKNLARTEGHAPTIARLALGLVMFPHGAQKAFGWFGGYGFDGTIGFFESLGIPAVLGALVIAGELLGSVALIVGAGARVAAASIAAIMIGAVVTVHLPYGFFMNWYGAQGGEGFEFHILAVALAAVVAVAGAGHHSVDEWLARR